MNNNEQFKREAVNVFMRRLVEEYCPNGLLSLEWRSFSLPRQDWLIRRIYADHYNARHPRKKISWRRLNRPQLAAARQQFTFAQVALPVLEVAAGMLGIVTFTPTSIPELEQDLMFIFGRPGASLPAGVLHVTTQENGR